MPAKTNTPAALGGTKNSPDEPESNRAGQDLAMTHTSEIPPQEIVFVDPGVSDIETLLGHLRPELEAMLLDPVRPPDLGGARRQSSLAAVRVIAHARWLASVANSTL